MRPSARPRTIRAFRPSRPTELDSLDMEVWLLWGLQPVAARGRDRLRAITIGKHGVQIARGAGPRTAAARRGRRASPRRPGASPTGVPEGGAAARRLAAATTPR